LPQYPLAWSCIYILCNVYVYLTDSSTLLIVQLSTFLLHCWIAGVLNSWVHLCSLFRCSLFFYTVEYEEFSTHGFNFINCSAVHPSSPLLDSKISQLMHGFNFFIVQMSALLLNCWIAGVLNSWVQLATADVSLFFYKLKIGDSWECTVYFKLRACRSFTLTIPLFDPSCTLLLSKLFKFCMCQKW
jgi:hypothetical protein